MIRRKYFEELGKKYDAKIESQEELKKYTNIFAIFSKGIIGYEIYKNEKYFFFIFFIPYRLFNNIYKAYIVNPGKPHTSALVSTN